MSDLDKHFIAGISCNATGCKTVREIPPELAKVIVDGERLVTRWGAAARRFYREAAEDGWQRWNFLRGTRDYCSEHKPRPGHTMERLW